MVESRIIGYFKAALGIAVILFVFFITSSALSQTSGKIKFDNLSANLDITLNEINRLERHLDSYTKRINSSKEGASGNFQRSRQMNDWQARSKVISDRLATLHNKAQKIQTAARKAALSYMNSLEIVATTNPEASEMQALKSERARVKSWLIHHSSAETRGFLPKISLSTEDAEALGEKADLLRDREDQINNHIKQIKNRISEVKQRQKLLQERDWFIREESMFDEQVYFARPVANTQSEKQSSSTAEKESVSPSPSDGNKSKSDGTKDEATAANNTEPDPGVADDGNNTASSDSSGGYFVRGWKATPPPPSEAESATNEAAPNEGTINTLPDEPPIEAPQAAPNTGAFDAAALPAPAVAPQTSYPLNIENPSELPTSTLYTSTDIGYLESELRRWKKISNRLKKQQKTLYRKIKKLEKSSKR